MAGEKFKTQPESLLVSGDRVFFSLQGEGPTLGQPAVFLRLHLCNLHCVWCDTKYTWDAGLDEAERWSLEKAWETIGQYPARRLVVTGGEPLLQSPAIDGLLHHLPDDWKVEIETNGTISPTAAMVERGVQFNVSPKLANSGEERARRYRPEALKAFKRLAGVTFKFVVTTGEDLGEVAAIVEECRLDKEDVIVMPEGTSQRTIAMHGRSVVVPCKERGWRLLPRLQVLLWGQRRGI